jgi:branched-chain amino acid aminotransferase
MFQINGKIVPEQEAFVPAMDRGFLFGDGVYEVIRTRGGKLFHPELHYARLIKSAERLRIPFSWSLDDLIQNIEATREAAGAGDHYVRIILTRGTGLAPNIDPAHAPADPNVVLLVRPLELPSEADYARGWSAWLVNTLRNHRRALDPAIKSGNYLNNIIALMEAKDHGADVALLLNSEGYLTEAPTSNAWIVKDGRTLTPPPEAGILLGITRGLLLDMARKQDLPVYEEEISRENLLAADEIFLTSTLKDILAITTLNGNPVGDGKPGPITKDLAKRFAEFLS